MSEPIKLTQAQALFAVLAGNSIPRHERVYYRDGALRSTLYSPIMAFDDSASNAVNIAIEVMHITPIYLAINDDTFTSVSLGIEKTLSAKPEGTDYTTNAVSLSITVSKVIKTPAIDSAFNSASLNVVKYNIVSGFTNDNATNIVTLGVTKL